MDLTDLGTLLRTARERSGLTQADLARMAGQSRATINYAERGRVAIGAETLLTIMNLLDLGIESRASQDHVVRMVATSASVSYRQTLPSAELVRALATGDIPERWLPQIATALDETSDRLLMRVIREVASRTGEAPERIWRNAQQMAERTSSTHPRWRHVA